MQFPYVSKIYDQFNTQKNPSPASPHENPKKITTNP